MGTVHGSGLPFCSRCPPEDLLTSLRGMFSQPRPMDVKRGARQRAGPLSMRRGRYATSDSRTLLLAHVRQDPLAPLLLYCFRSGREERTLHFGDENMKRRKTSLRILPAVDEGSDLERRRYPRRRSHAVRNTGCTSTTSPMKAARIPALCSERGPVIGVNSSCPGWPSPMGAIDCRIAEAWRSTDTVGAVRNLHEQFRCVHLSGLQQERRRSTKGHDRVWKAHARGSAL